MARLSEAFVGAKIGRLTVVEIRRIPYQRKSGKVTNRPWAVCDCDCGTKGKEIILCSLGSLVVSCGCVWLEAVRERLTTHGRSKNDKAYIAWCAMKQRVLYDKGEHYHLYGGRGLTLDAGFLGDKGFENFLAEVGEPPSSKHSIDRRDSELGYVPGNLRWATATEQVRNRRCTLRVKCEGKIIPLADAVEMVGLRYSKVYDRLFVLGWSVPKALESDKFTGIENDRQS